MMDCMILGDSIAQGVAATRPQCAQITQRGITTPEFSRVLIQQVHARHVLISVGSNDWGVGDMHRHLTQIRSRIQSGEVTWLLSANNAQAAQQVQQVARTHGDRVIQVSLVVGSDGVHPSPAGYHRLNQMWRRL